MVSALAHADEQLVDEFSKAASILDLKIKPLDHKKLEGGVFYLLSCLQCAQMTIGSEVLSERNSVK